VIASEYSPDGHLAVLVLLPANGARAWQWETVRRLQALREVDVVLHHVPTIPCRDAQWKQLVAAVPSVFEVMSAPLALPSAGPLAGQACDLVVDLAGAADAAYWQSRGKHGLWRLCDGEGVQLAEAFASHTAICSGMGGELFLVDSDETVRSTLRFHALPDYRAALEVLYVQAAWLIEHALHGLRLGQDARAPRPPFQPRPAPNRRQREWQRRMCAVRTRLRRLSDACLSENWMIGLVDAPIHTLLSGPACPQVSWLGQRDAGLYRADPFGVPGDAARLYCEEYEFREARGRIVMLELDDRRGFRAPVPAPLPQEVHRSYPYLIEDQGRLYCVPEAAAERSCHLYEVTAEGWRRVASLVEDTAAADPTLFRWEGRFWLAYTDISLGGFDNLCLSWADALAGPWTSHPCNPVKIDHRSSRPAGTPFVLDETLYRPAQDCGSGYGQAVVFNRVLRCTPHDFQEEPVRLLAPDRRGPNPHGLHTVSAWGERTLVDGKRLELNLSELGRKVGRRLFGGKRLNADASPTDLRAQALGACAAAATRKRGVR
jgi:hypothetical protein